MADDSLFRELCKTSILRIGWHLASGDSRDDFLSDPVGYEDFGAELSRRIPWLVQQIKDARYRAHHLVEIEIPKSAFSVRPGNILPIEESTILHAVTYLLAPQLDRHLRREVYSYRLQKDWKKRVQKGKGLFGAEDQDLAFLKNKTIRKINPLEPWYLAWPDFDKARIRAARDEGYTHLTRTDIASYFENIDLRLLETQLGQLVHRETKLISLLMRILTSWTRATSMGVPIGRGIPQGNDVSSFLGNIYLLPLDKALHAFSKARDAVWFRYLDDVEVYSRDYETARDAVFVINGALRGLYLNLQGSKTEVLSGPDLDAALSTAHPEALDAAFKALEGVDVRARKNAKKVTAILANTRPITRPFRSGLPRSVIGIGKRESQVLRRAMTLYGLAGRPYLKDVALAALREPPELRMLNKVLSYLSKLPHSHHEGILNQLIDMVEGDVFVLPFHAARVLDSIRLFHPVNAAAGIAGRISAWALKKKRHWPVRQKALEALAILPYREDHALSQACRSLDDTHSFVRRAALVLLSRGPVQAVRDHVQKLAYDPDPASARLALLWHRNLHDADFALRELGRFSRSSNSPAAITSRLPRLWLLRCSPEVRVVRAVRDYVLRLPNASRSARLAWHVAQLAQKTEWSLSVAGGVV